MKKTVKEPFSHNNSILLRCDPRFICNENTDVVIEGYPRSANSFLVNFLTHILKLNSIKINIAHHTHSPENVLLGIKYNKPCLVLIREPIDAILSFIIYSSKDVEYCYNRYINFYTSLIEHKENILFVDFNELIISPNSIISRFNNRFNKNLPTSENEKDDIKLVLKNAKERSINNSMGNHNVLKAGVPSIERDELKKELLSSVSDYLENNLKAKLIYSQLTNM